MTREAGAQEKGALALSVEVAFEGLMRRSVAGADGASQLPLALLEGFIGRHPDVIIANVGHGDTVRYSLRHGADQILSRLLALPGACLPTTAIVDLGAGMAGETRTSKHESFLRAGAGGLMGRPGRAKALSLALMAALCPCPHESGFSRTELGIRLVGAATDIQRPSEPAVRLPPSPAGASAGGAGGKK